MTASAADCTNLDELPSIRIVYGEHMSVDLRKVFSTVGVLLAAALVTRRCTPTTPGAFPISGSVVSRSSSSVLFESLNRSVAMKPPSPGPSEYRRLQTDRD